MVSRPVEPGRIGEVFPYAGEVVCFAQEVCEGEAQVEGRVAEVDNLVVEQHEGAFADEDVLRAVVAVDQGVAPGASLLYERAKEIGGLRNLPGGVIVIRLQPQRLEERAVPEGGFGLLSALVTPAVDRPQEPPELLDVVVLQPA